MTVSNQGKSRINFFARTIALELALIEVCKQIRVDIRAIKKMASCPPDDPDNYKFPEVDTELVKKYTELFAAAVPG